MKALGAAGAAGLVPADARATDTAAPATAPDAAASAPTAPYLFFNTIEATWVEAALNRIVPADELGPAGVALGIAAFIDGQLAGA